MRLLLFLFVLFSATTNSMGNPAAATVGAPVAPPTEKPVAPPSEKPEPADPTPRPTPAAAIVGAPVAPPTEKPVAPPSEKPEPADPTPRPTPAPTLSNFRIMFRQDLFEDVVKDDNSITFSLRFEHFSDPCTGCSLVARFYSYTDENRCVTSNDSETPIPQIAYDTEMPKNAYHEITRVDIELPLQEWEDNNDDDIKLCIRFGIEYPVTNEVVSHIDLPMTINAHNGEYVGSFSASGQLADDSDNVVTSLTDIQVSDKVDVQAFLCGVPGVQGITGLGTPSATHYKVGQKFRICVDIMEVDHTYYVDNIKKMVCKVEGQYEKTIIEDGMATDGLTDVKWSGDVSEGWIQGIGVERQKVSGGVTGSVVTSTVVSGYVGADAGTIQCEGTVEARLWAEANALYSLDNDVEVHYIHTLPIGVAFKECYDLCELESYWYYGLQCLNIDEGVIDCVCSNPNYVSGGSVDVFHYPELPRRIEQTDQFTKNRNSGECSDIEIYSGFFLGGFNYHPFVYETTYKRRLQESNAETESEEFGFSITIGIQNEVDDLSRLQDLAAPGADPKVWTIADLVAGLATAVALAMAAI
ncbi:unnamed protein product [Pseudo-nitzschia multistriata]|uniref:Uncharacterized protein n=1 Tax=Pseudo-nitzschia multistriata TaxID=183589 RepID=A0A448ZC14_9STRA|nr:unnamed protein product [Pseudo-nitzschia multistriata]